MPFNITSTLYYCSETSPRLSSNMYHISTWVKKRPIPNHNWLYSYWCKQKHHRIPSSWKKCDNLSCLTRKTPSVINAAGRLLEANICNCFFCMFVSYSLAKKIKHCMSQTCYIPCISIKIPRRVSCCFVSIPMIPQRRNGQRISTDTQVGILMANVKCLK